MIQRVSTTNGREDIKKARKKGGGTGGDEKTTHRFPSSSSQHRAPRGEGQAGQAGSRRPAGMGPVRPVYQQTVEPRCLLPRAFVCNRNVDVDVSVCQVERARVWAETTTLA